MTYDQPSRAPAPKVSQSLPVGTQERFIAAARCAAAGGTPLNTLLTIRWDSLAEASDTPVDPVARIPRIVESLRKWLTARGHAAHYIWVRERTENEPEHWHLGFHVSASLRADLIAHLEKLTGVPRARSTAAGEATAGELARGEGGAWHIAKDNQPRRKGYWIAAWLGKGEPSTVMFRGQPRANRKKPVRGIERQGEPRLAKYDRLQGVLAGKPARFEWFQISKSLQQAKEPAAHA